MTKVITPRSFESTNYTIESVPVDFETHQPNEPEIYKVSEVDSQTIGGRKVQFELSTDVVDRVQELRIKDNIWARNRSMTRTRALALGQ